MVQSDYRYDFYMYEYLDGGAGAVATYPHTLFVFTSGADLVQHLEAEQGELNQAFEGEEIEVDLVNRLGSDRHLLWVVRAGVVVKQADLDDFSSMVLPSGARVLVSRHEEIRAVLAEQSPPSITVELDVEGLRQALPAAEGPLPAGVVVALTWQVPKGDSRIGERVKLGATELASGQNSF